MITVQLTDGQRMQIPGDLVPCPNCGDTTPEIIETGAGFYVRCPRYACNTGWFKFYGTAYAAAKAWNEGKAAGLL